jgi:cytochrome c peroxidase
MQILLVLHAAAQAADSQPPVPLGLPPLPADRASDLSRAKIELGKQLFFDKRLSADQSLSCASCHDPEQGWADGKPVGTGIGGKKLARNVPSVVNSVYLRDYFWDGRATTLEEVVPLPIVHPDEMGMSLDDLARRLDGIEGYRTRFQETFGSPVSADHVAEVLASFLKTLLAGNSPYDRYRAGDLAALSPAARRGLHVFLFRSNCGMCHRGPLLSDGGFHNLGVGMDKPNPDIGRAAVTQVASETGRFRTPSLRDLSRTGPYMHDGRFSTLEEVVEFYEHAGILNPYRMSMLNVVPLTDEEKKDLVKFLEEALTSDDYPIVTPPTLPE